jgi:hypothetical protein
MARLNSCGSSGGPIAGVPSRFYHLMCPRPITAKKKAADRPPFRRAFSRIGMKGLGARLKLKARSEEHQEPFPLFELGGGDLVVITASSRGGRKSRERTHRRPAIFC